MREREFLTDLHNHLPQKVAVLGAARSGIAAARYFRDRGVRVLISDICGEEKLSVTLNEARLNDIEREALGHSERVLNCDLIILSPGIRSELDILNKARDIGIPVWSEIELGFRASNANFLALTGSTGKSTTVSMLSSVLECSGKETVLAGNIGLPLIGISPSLSQETYVVVEVSSFQLETIDTFRPKVSAILNLMKNHLDRYDCEEDYYQAKKRIVENQSGDDVVVLNADDPKLREWSEQIKNNISIVWFGLEPYGEECFYLSEGKIKYRSAGREGEILRLSDMKLKGEHNHLNACAAAAMAFVCGILPGTIEKGLNSFRGLSHRLEFVEEISGVGFYNDSKATTAESIICAVRAFDTGVHLIAGGRDKGCDFDSAREAVGENVKSIALIGEASERIAKSWNGLAPMECFTDLESAVEYAFKNASISEQVVFSPGCSSFDMFRNFEQRGEMFRKAVRNLCGDRVK
ncbi:UDP-N-acetylmuramoylalanine--D-glutamate ligase [Chitinispirillum alkaliphilum]|nr:UDP-N-acetylmuramoylalanine--D-glutamate ligase [Chitinispirillum alkaliphilum]